MPTLTPNYSFNQPLVNDPVDEDLWGGQLNSNWGSIDSFLLTATNDLNNPLTFADSPYTLLDTDQNKVLSVDASGGNVVINLLSGAAAGDGYKVSIKKTDSSENTVTINGNIDGGSSSVLVRENNVITVASDGTDWNSLTSNASTLLIPSVSINFAASPYVVDASDQNKILLVDATGGDVDIDLQTSLSAGNGFELIVKKIDASANVVNVNANGAETIDGPNTQTLTRQYETITPIADATKWNLSETIDWIPTSDIGTGPNQIVQFNGSAQYPANDGSSITNIGFNCKLLTSQSFSGATLVDFDTNIDNTYNTYLFTFDINQSNAQDIGARTSSNGGISYDAGGGDYNGTPGGSSITIYDNTAGPASPLIGSVWLVNPSSTARETGIQCNLIANPASLAGTNGGFRSSVNLVNAIRFFPFSGTVTGQINMYGLIA